MIKKIGPSIEKKVIVKKDLRSSSKKPVSKYDTQTMFLNNLHSTRTFGLDSLKLNLNNLFYYSFFLPRQNKKEVFDADYRGITLSIFDIISMINNKTPLQHLTVEDVNLIKFKTYRFEVRVNFFLSMIGSPIPPILSNAGGADPKLYGVGLNRLYNFAFDKLSQKNIKNFELLSTLDKKEKDQIITLIITEATKVGKLLMEVLRVLVPKRDLSFYQGIDFNESKTAFVNDGTVIKYVILHILFQKPLVALQLDDPQKNQIIDYCNEVSLLIEYGMHYNLIETSEIAQLVKTSLWTSTLDKFKSKLSHTSCTVIIKILEQLINNLYNKITESTLNKPRETFKFFKDVNSTENLIIVEGSQSTISEVPANTKVISFEDAHSSLDKEAFLKVSSSNDQNIVSESNEKPVILEQKHLTSGDNGLSYFNELEGVSKQNGDYSKDE